MTAVSRRSFVTLCLAGSCSAYTVAASCVEIDEERTPDRAGLERLVGDWYLENFPEENDRGRLLSLLAKALETPREDDGATAVVIDRVGLRRACRADYARGDTVYVDGWLCARTELRVCALAVLS